MKSTILIPIAQVLLTAAILASPATAQSTERVSVDAAGLETILPSLNPSISASGRFVAFESRDEYLVPGDTNLRSDIFVHDHLTGQITRVSVDSTGVQGNLYSYSPSISADGRFVAFWSFATNLVPGDTAGWADIFVHDRQTGQTSRVSLGSAGNQGNGDSTSPSLSADGRFVAFYSYADNLVPNDTNGGYDVFVHDRATGQISRVSVTSAGVQANYNSSFPSISGDGRYVAFSSEATDLVPGDTNVWGDIFVHDRQTAQTTRVSLDSAGGEGNWYSNSPSISADGRYVCFDTRASNLVPGDLNGLVDVLLHDRVTSLTTMVCISSAGVYGNGTSFEPAISADGRTVAFSSYSTNLVAGDTNDWADVFVHDRLTGATNRVSLSTAGGQGDRSSFDPAISANGSAVAFESLAPDLVAGDTNSTWDIFLHLRAAPGPSLAMSGACPGLLTLTIENATPGGRVVLVHGFAGAFVKPTQPCQGLLLGIGAPLLGASLTADASGTAILNINLPLSACGRSVQAVDGATCTATNVVVL